MKNISKILIVLSAAFVVLWIVPTAYNFATIEPSKSTFTLYSAELNDFISISSDPERGVIGTTTDGTTYSESEVDAALPLFYARQLELAGTAPDSIGGVPFNYREIQRTNIFFRSSAMDVNTPLPKLYFLLESMPKRGELYMPSDVFRFTHSSMEFIDMESNEVDRAKSEEFTAVLSSKGFSFPARELSGVTSVKKEYDEGFLVVDSSGSLFHIKQMASSPYCRKIEIPSGLDITKVFITEFSDREMLGLLTDSNNNLYVIERDGYRVVKSGVESFNPFEDNLLIVGNMFDWTVRINSANEENIYAISSKDFSLIKHRVRETSSHGVDIISFSSPQDRYIYPRFF